MKSEGAGLQRHFGLFQATALNVSMIVGAGVFATIPLMLGELPGPYAMLGWLAAGALILVDGLIWSELGAALPGSGGSFLYLLECYGPKRWGRLMAFLFIWQFLISGPLELASGLVAMGTFSNGLSKRFQSFNEEHSYSLTLAQWQVGESNPEDPLKEPEPETLKISVGPAQSGAFCIGLLIIALLYRRISILGRLTTIFGIGVVLAILWILIEGWTNFDRAVAFDYSGSASAWPKNFGGALGGAMILAIYSYLGYYQVCYIGDEVRDPGRTIPRSIMLSAALVIAMFVGLHLAMLGTISWKDVPTKGGSFNLAAEFMRRIHGDWAAVVVTILLIGSCFGSVFAGMLGYSRIPYGAARYGHFFSVFGKVHPVHFLPHVSLFFVGGLTLFWSLFDLGSVINALITTRILEQFIGQIVGVVLLRRYRPELARPYKMLLYPLPCALALGGWLFVYWSAPWVFIVLGLATLATGVVAFALRGDWRDLVT